MSDFGDALPRNPSQILELNNKPRTSKMLDSPPATPIRLQKTTDCVTVRKQKSADTVSMELLDQITNADLVRLTGTHITSVRRWRRQRKLPVAIARLLKFVALHELDQLGWKGWKLNDGVLISPNGDCFSPGQVQGIELRTQQLAFLEAEARLFRATPAQPLPSEQRSNEFLKKVSA